MMKYLRCNYKRKGTFKLSSNLWLGVMIQGCLFSIHVHNDQKHAQQISYRLGLESTCQIKFNIYFGERYVQIINFCQK